MPKRKKEASEPLFDKGDPGFFRSLVKECIAAYEKLPNDGLALDYCKVSDRKLRALILADEEYKAETRNIYARQRFQEVEEIEHLEKLASNEASDDADDYYELRDGGKKSKKASGADKDMLNMRFKAAQMKRELRAELADMPGSGEQDMVNLMFVLVEREEFEKLVTAEISMGTGDADIDALIGTKEELPDGTAENMTARGKTKVPDEEAEFDVLENGEIVER
jgi:hypothetical protein